MYLHEYEDLHDARAHIGHFLEQVYMYKRVHSSLDYLTPAEFEARWQQQDTSIESCDPKPSLV
jgi:putative transposase